MPDYPCSIIKDGRGVVVRFPPFISQNQMDELTARFVTLDDDVFIATYPRSGTTWTEQIVHLLVNNGRQGSEPLTDAVPWLETLPGRVNGMTDYLQSMRGRRLFTSHLPFGLMPDASPDKGKYIYVARNPKDVAVSYYHHDRSKSNYEGSWEQHFELFIEGQVMFGNWFDHVLAWWRASTQTANILFVKYEEMKGDFGRVVGNLAEFLEVELNPTLLEKVLHGSSFKQMSTNEKTNFSWITQKEGVPTHFRKGIIGDWRNQFSEDQSQRFDNMYSDRMSGSDLQFDFGDDFIK